MISLELVKRLKNLPEWPEVERHFKDCVRALDTTLDIQENEDHDKVARGKKYAVTLVERILQPFDVADLTEEDARQETLERLGLREIDTDTKKDV